MSGFTDSEIEYIIERYRIGHEISGGRVPDVFDPESGVPNGFFIMALRDGNHGMNVDGATQADLHNYVVLAAKREIERTAADAALRQNVIETFNEIRSWTH